MFLKARAAGKSTPPVDVGEVIAALLEVKDKKRGQGAVLLACKAWSQEAVTDALLAQGEHKAKQKAVPALEMLRVLVASVGVSQRSQAGLLKTATGAAQMSDPNIRRAALEVLAAMHAALGEPLLEACVPLMRPPILASLRELLAKQDPRSTPAKEKENKTATAAVAAPVAPVSTPIRARPPSQLPAPSVSVSASTSAAAAAASVTLPTVVVEHARPETQLPVPAIQTAPAAASMTAAASSAGTSRCATDEWSRMSGWVESQLRALSAERAKSESLSRRCEALESENEELVAVARELESEAERRGGMSSIEEVQSMTMEQLAEAEAAHQEALVAIAQRKKALLEGMARKNGCSACGKQRAKSTVLFPCRHVVCSGCGATLSNCPDCRGAIQQRFDLPENVHV